MLVVFYTQINHNAGKSPYKLVYGHKPTINTTTQGPCLTLPQRVPNANDINVKQAKQDQEEKKHVNREGITLKEEQFQVDKKSMDGKP